MMSTTIFTNGSIFTARASEPWVEALAVAGASIVGVGDRRELLETWPDAVEHDLAGSTLVPGFIDAHNHFLATGEGLAEGLAEGLGSVDLRFPDVASADDLLRMVAAAAATTAPGRHISGTGFDHGKYRLPTREQLDRASAGHAVFLHHVSGHAVLVNSVALSLAGLDESVADPAGGRFERDADGRLTGLCLDAAMGAVMPSDVDIGSHGPNFHTRAPLEELVEAVERASAAYLAAGLTCVCDAQVTAREMRAYREALERGSLGVRTVCMPLSHQLEEFRALGLAGPIGDDRLSIGHLKIYADGTLTGKTAGFSDAVGATDQVATYFHEPERLVALIAEAWSDGWRIGVHAQGDRAIGLVLDGFERGHRAVPRADARPRIEHAGYPGPDGIERMRRLGVIPVSQPSYLFEFGDEYVDSLGEHAHDLQPWRDQLAAGLKVVISSDSDVASYRPLETVANAMARSTRSGRTLGSRHRLSLEEALTAHTIDAAFAVGLEGNLGSAEAGTAADLTAIRGDLRAMEPDEIRRSRVSMTMIAGRTVFGDEP